MKHENHLKILVNAAFILITCWNGSIADSSTKTKRPDVNIYGTIQDHSNKEAINVEDILIGGRYNNIPVYYPAPEIKPSDQKIDLDPKTNKALLNLDEIKEIELINADKPIEHQQSFNNTKYSEITVKTITDSSQRYLIESNREITCVRIDKGPEKSSEPILEERRLNIIHIKKLVIKGKKGVVDNHESKSRTDASNSDVGKITAKTEEIIDAIEKNVENLNDQSNINKFKNTLTTLLRSLRNQLQKMLSLIKS